MNCSEREREREGGGEVGDIRLIYSTQKQREGSYLVS